MTRGIDSGDALLLVDVQNDFCPGGALAIDEGDAVVPVLNRCVDKAQAVGARIVASRDWHPREHVSFRARGGPWPEHCVQQSLGAEFHPQLNVPEQAQVLNKGTEPDEDNYSAFDRTGLAQALKNAGVAGIWIGGLAQDVCVKATVLDACREGFAVRVLTDATRAVELSPGDGEAALRAMREAGAELLTSDAL